MTSRILILMITSFLNAHRIRKINYTTPSPLQQQQVHRSSIIRKVKRTHHRIKQKSTKNTNTKTKQKYQRKKKEEEEENTT